METSKIYTLLIKEIKIKFDTKKEAADKMGIPKQNLDDFLKRLKNEKDVSFKNLVSKLDFLGFEIKIQKKKSKN